MKTMNNYEKAMEALKKAVIDTNMTTAVADTDKPLQPGYVYSHIAGFQHIPAIEESVVIDRESMDKDVQLAVVAFQLEDMLTALSRLDKALSNVKKCDEYKTATTAKKKEISNIYDSGITAIATEVKTMADIVPCDYLVWQSEDELDLRATAKALKNAVSNMAYMLAFIMLKPKITMPNMVEIFDGIVSHKDELYTNPTGKGEWKTELKAHIAEVLDSLNDMNAIKSRTPKVTNDNLKNVASHYCTLSAYKNDSGRVAIEKPTAHRVYWYIMCEVLASTYKFDLRTVKVKGKETVKTSLKIK